MVILVELEVPVAVGGMVEPVVIVVVKLVVVLVELDVLVGVKARVVLVELVVLVLLVVLGAVVVLVVLGAVVVLTRGHKTSNINVRMFGDVRYFLNIEMFDVRMFANIQMFECSLIFKFSDVRIFICSVESECSDVQCSVTLDSKGRLISFPSPVIHHQHRCSHAEQNVL